MPGAFLPSHVNSAASERGSDGPPPEPTLVEILSQPEIVLPILAIALLALVISRGKWRDMAAREQGGGRGDMRWADMGVLDKLALVSFIAGGLGFAIAAGSFHIFENSNAGVIVLEVWLSPFILWWFCWFAANALRSWATTTGMTALFILSGAIFKPDSWADLPLMLIAVPVFCGIMAIFGEPAMSVLNFGRKNYRW